MKQYDLDITDSQITFNTTDNPNTIQQVMMDWEDDLMKAHSDLVCHNKEDVLEFGFGLGISATYIQSHNPKSHTIIEIHPQIIKKAKLWALDKPNVTIIEGDWVECFDQLDKYDGIFFDTYGDNNYLKFGEKAEVLAKSGAHITWWNSLSEENNVYGFENVTYTKYSVDPPKNNYFVAKKYYLPLKIFT
tara:strand:- start:208 stop:774 length:567 start_codon:yes stop_codon:yes gene_type:complete